MKIIEEKLYRYDELSDEAKYKARDQWVSSFSWEYEYNAIDELIRVMDEFATSIGASYYYQHDSLVVNPGEFVYDLEDLRFHKVENISTNLDELYYLIDMWNNAVDDLKTICDEICAHWEISTKIEWERGWNEASKWCASHPCRFNSQRFWEIVGNLLKDIARAADVYVDGFEEHYSCKDFVEEELETEKYSDVWFYPDGVMYEAHEAPAA